MADALRISIVVREDLDLAGNEPGVRGARGTRADEAVDANAELVAQALGDREGGRAIRIADDLHEALAVAQVDEDDAAMVAAAVDPAGERDGLGEMAAVDATAVVGAFHGGLRTGLLAWMRGRTGAVGAARGARRSGPAAQAGPMSRARARRSGQFRDATGGSTAAGAMRWGGSGAAGGGSVGGAEPRGATTPIEMMYLSASSTDMSSSRTFERGSMMK